MSGPARRPLGATGLEVFPLCLGSNVFGWTLDEAASFAVLDAYVAAGGNFIDTADVYSTWGEGNSGGESEQIIGDWMRARGNRDDLGTGEGGCTGGVADDQPLLEAERREARRDAASDLPGRPGDRDQSVAHRTDATVPGVARTVQAKKRCCKSSPRCKRCPIVLKRLKQAGLAEHLHSREFRLDPSLHKAQLKAVRRRAR